MGYLTVIDGKIFHLHKLIFVNLILHEVVTLSH